MSEELRNNEAAKDWLDEETAIQLIKATTRAIFDTIDKEKVKARAMAYMVLKRDDLDMDALEEELTDGIEEIAGIDVEALVDVMFSNESYKSGLTESYATYEELTEAKKMDN